MNGDQRGSSDSTIRECPLRGHHVDPTKGIEAIESTGLSEENQNSGGGGKSGIKASCQRYLPSFPLGDNWPAVRLLRVLFIDMGRR